MPSPTCSRVLRDGRSVADGPLAESTNEALVAHMVGHPLASCLPGATAARTRGGLDEVRDLVAPPVVKQASFMLRKGEILGLAGLM